MNQTSTVRFSGQSIETIVTNMASMVDEYINHFRSMQGPLIVGLDCESEPNYIRGMSRKTAVLQLCIQNKCLIVQIFHMSHIPESLKSFLSDPSATFVGADIGKDVTKLRDDYGLVVSKFVDLQELAMALENSPFSGGTRPGLKDMARVIVDLHMEKPFHVTISNWEARELSGEQIEYACIDAYASYKIGHKLLVGNDGHAGLGSRLLKPIVCLAGIWMVLDKFL